MSKKIKILVASMMVAITALTGCGTSQTVTANQTTKEVEVSKDTETETVVEEGRTVIDQMGRKVILPETINRIVSSYYISSSLLIALGAEDKVVGLEKKADTREIYKKAAPQFLDLPGVGTSKNISVEETLALKPDLVILPYRLKDFVAQFEAVDIPVVVVEPESMEQFKACISLIGEAINEKDKAQQLLDYYTEKTNEITKLTEAVTDRPTVYISGGSSAMTTCTSKMYQNDLIKLAGGTNVSEALTDGYWANVSKEQLLSWNPEYMFKVSYATYEASEFTKAPEFQKLQAVTKQQVGTFPSKLEAWDYPTPSSIMGVLWLTNQLHPELYSVDTYIQDAEDFYHTFYDIDITKEDMGL